MADTGRMIRELVDFDVDELQSYHKNPRRGSVDQIARSLEVNGQYRPIVVNLGTKTGRPLEVLAGNHTLAGSRRLGWPRILGTTVDVDDLQAARIVAADNRTAELGDFDNDALAELLGELNDGDMGLDGTGYTETDLAGLLGDGDMPDFDPVNEDPIRLDQMAARLCQKCGYDVANNPRGLPEWIS